MEHDVGRLICAVCGDRIGVYEPFLYVQPNGSLISSSFRAIQDGRDRLHPGAVLLHGSCESKATVWRRRPGPRPS